MSLNQSFISDFSETSCCDFKVCKNALKLENSKKFALIVSHEQTGIVSLNFGQSYRHAWTLFGKNKETVNIISITCMQNILHS